MRTVLIYRCQLPAIAAHPTRDAKAVNVVPHFLVWTSRYLTMVLAAHVVVSPLPLAATAFLSADTESRRGSAAADCHSRVTGSPLSQQRVAAPLGPIFVGELCHHIDQATRRGHVTAGLLLPHYPHFKQVAWSGVTDLDFSLRLYSDAVLSSNPRTLRGTSGVATMVVGPSTRCMLSACSRRQTCTSHSAAEAENRRC